MSKGTITKVEAQTERKLAIGLITSKTFCEHLASIIPKDLFDEKWLNRIIAWAISYYKEFDEPIGSNLQDVFNKRSRRLQEEEKQVAELFLVDIAEEHSNNPDFDTSYWLKESRNLIKSRIITKKIEAAQEALKRGDVSDAEYALESYKPISEAASNGFSIMDVDRTISMLFDEENDTSLFTMEGEFGAFFGDIRRGDLVGLLAESKAGKSFAAWHIAMQAVEQGYNVLFISHEMTEHEVQMRHAEFLTHQTYLGKYHEKALYTNFDCKLNQIGRCREQCYIGKGIKVPESGDLDTDYVPCAVCAGNFKSKYEPALWCREITKPKLTRDEAASKLRAATQFLKGNLYVETFPIGTANCRDIENLIHSYALRGIYFQVLVDDYLNLHSGLKDWQDISHEWQEAKRIGVENSLAYISPVHKAGSFHGSGERGFHTISGSKDVARHLTKMIELNRSEKDAEYNIIRANHVGGRIGRASPADTCLISQVREHGWTVYDSVWLRSATTFEELQEKKKETEKPNKRRGFGRN